MPNLPEQSKWLILYKSLAVAYGFLRTPLAIIRTVDSGTSPATATEVPADIVAAVKLLVGHYYEHREAVTPINHSVLPMAVEALLGPHEVPVL